MQIQSHEGEAHGVLPLFWGNAPWTAQSTGKVETGIAPSVRGRNVGIIREH